MALKLEQYQCKYPGCSKSFVRRGHLNRHMLNHESLKSFKCEVCGGEFKRSDVFSKHRKIHKKDILETEQIQKYIADSRVAIEDVTANKNEFSTTLEPSHFNDSVGPMISSPQVASDQDEIRGIVTGLYQDNDLSWLFIPAAKDSNCKLVSSDTIEEYGRTEIFAPLTVDFFHSVLGPPEVDTFSQSMSINNLLIPDTQPSKNTEQWEFISEQLQDVLGSAISDISISEKGNYFSPETLKHNFDLYFCTFHDHFPILHRASFTKVPWKIPFLLLISIIILGTVKGSEENYFISVKIHEKLIWKVFSHPDLIPSKLWIIQTLALIQAFAKMASTRHQHEISATFHSAIITILKRDGSCTNMKTLRNKEGFNLELSKKWNLWIEHESIKRVVFLFFIMDSQHAVLFGHIPSMSVTEIMLELPCSEDIWDIDSSSLWENQSISKATEKPRLFLELLKSLMDDQSLPVTISSYSKLIMLHGLLAVIWSIVRDEPESFQIENQECVQKTSMEVRKKAILARAVETWSYSLLNRMPSKAIEACSALYGITYLTLYTSKSSVLEILTFCGSPSLMGRPMTKSDKVKAFGSVERWSKSFEAIQCVIHALLSIQRITLSPDRSSKTTYNNGIYQAANDDIVFRPWCLYISTLVVWSYCFFTNGKRFDSKISTGLEERIVAEQFMIDMIHALQKRVRVKDTSDIHLVPLPDLGDCRSLVVVVRESLKGCRWEMLNDACHFLGELIKNWNAIQGDEKV